MKIKTERPGYSQAHNRIRKIRGSARMYPCVDCGGQAHHWSYDGKDPDALSETQPDGRVWLYSTNLDHYDPRCRSCHTEFDRSFTPSPCGTYNGSQGHIRAREPLCDPCRDARRAWMQAYRLRRKAAR